MAKEHDREWTNEEWQKSLQQGLSRVGDALAKAGVQAPVPSAAAAKPRRSAVPETGLALMTTTLIVLAIATGHWWLLAPALLCGIGAAFLLVQRFGQALLGPSHPFLSTTASGAFVGMGAEIADDAVLEAGAIVEAGATVRSGAIVRAGATVRMGATIDEGAVIETGAVISWGADVKANAIVGEGCTVGAGATVRKGARMPAGATLWPGGDFVAGTGASAASSTPAAIAAPDPRIARVNEVCNRLEAELLASPPNVREFLGGSSGAIGALRRTCLDLLEREKSLRREVTPEALQRLTEERAVLAKRIEAEPDEIVKRSLGGAIAAIEEQQRQRELLRRNAARLEAEQTRLVWTLEGLSAQLVRLRTAGVDLQHGPDAELERSVLQLRSEIDAIADSLETVARGEEPAAIAASPNAATPVSDDGPAAPRAHERDRT